MRTLPHTDRFRHGGPFGPPGDPNAAAGRSCDMDPQPEPLRYRLLDLALERDMRNWRELLRRVSAWLEPGGRAFVHVFSHSTLPYLFAVVARRRSPRMRARPPTARSPG
jgi:hypothetical protein